LSRIVSSAFRTEKLFGNLGGNSGAATPGSVSVGRSGFALDRGAGLLAVSQLVHHVGEA